MATTAQCLNELVNQKNALADILIEKGVEANQEEKFNTLIPKVADIKSSGGEFEEMVRARIEQANPVNLKFPNGITKIGAYAFYNNNGLIIPEIFPDTLTTIGMYAFAGCKLTTSISAKNVTRIETASLQANINLHTIYAPKCEYVWHFSFQKCTALESITLGTLTSSHAQAFQDCNALKNLVIGEGTNATLGLQWSPLLTKESIYNIIENLADMNGQTAPKFTVHDNCTAIDAEHLEMINAKNWEHNFILEG